LDELIDQLVDRFVERMVAADRRKRWRKEDLGQAADDFEEHLQCVSEDLALDRWETLRTEGFVRRAEEALKAAGVELDEESVSRLAWELGEAWLAAGWMLADEHRGGAERKPIETVLRRSKPAGSPRKQLGPARHLGPSLAEAVKAYQREASRTWSPRHAINVRSYLSSLLDHVGAAKRVSSVQKAEIIVWREKLRRGRGETTVAKYIKAATRFFRFCVDSEWIETSPAERLPGGNSARDTRGQDELRQAVSDADLRAIVGGPAFAQLRHGSARDCETFWAVLLLVYTGARRAEVAQAWVEDVREIDGVWCLRIEASDEPGAEKSVKTAAGRRVVPLHSDLLVLGMVDYLEERRAAGERRLFPGSAAQGGDRLTRAWQSLRQDAGVDPDAQLHGLRHRIATQLKHAGVQEVRIAELLGHANASITTGRYGKRYDTAALREAVDHIENRGPLSVLFE
jgi:integrase